MVRFFLVVNLFLASNIAGASCYDIFSAPIKFAREEASVFPTLHKKRIKDDEWINTLTVDRRRKSVQVSVITIAQLDRLGKTIQWDILEFPVLVGPQSQMARVEWSSNWPVEYSRAVDRGKAEEPYLFKLNGEPSNSSELVGLDFLPLEKRPKNYPYSYGLRLGGRPLPESGRLAIHWHKGGYQTAQFISSVRKQIRKNQGRKQEVVSEQLYLLLSDSSGIPVAVEVTNIEGYEELGFALIEPK